MSRRRGLGWIIGVGALVVVAGVAWRVGASAQSPSQAAGQAAEPAASWVTAPVEWRTLAATVIQRGDIRAEVTAQAAVPVSVEGAPVVTQIIVAAGDQVVEGDRVVEVSGRPVFVLAGDVPVYRSLRPGMSGVDVAQLQAALGRLGYEPDTDGVYGPATKAAVTAFYDHAGYSPVPASPTATVDIAAAQQALTDANTAVAAAQAALDAAGQPASVVAQAQASMQQAQRALDEARAQRSSQVAVGEDEYNATVRARDRLTADPTTTPGDLDAANVAITQAGARLDDTRRTTADAVTTAEETLYVATIAYNETVAADTAAQAQADLDAATTQRNQGNANLAAVQTANGPTVPQGEVVFMPTMPARVIAATSALGPISADPTATTAGGGLVELAGGGLIVMTSIRPGDIGLVRAGMDAEILDETSATTYPATIADIATDVTTGPDGQLGYPTVITPADPLPDTLTGANVRVTITTAATETPELVVPLAAVSSAAGGTTRVSVVSDPNGVPLDVEVDAGLSADGFVAITPTNPDALHEGDLVVVGT
ncbi:MAG: peptidoglycan-binding domain-containing protein [Ilumatobacteraceae bacterium]